MFCGTWPCMCRQPHVKVTLAEQLHLSLYFSFTAIYLMPRSQSVGFLIILHWWEVLVKCLHIWASRPQLLDTVMDKRRGCEINNKRSMQAVEKGTVGSWRAWDKTLRNRFLKPWNRGKMLAGSDRGQEGGYVFKAFVACGQDAVHL